MLEEYIAKFIVHMASHIRKYVGMFFGLLISVLWLTLGFGAMLFVLASMYVGYVLGDGRIQGKIKKKIIEKLKED